MAVTVGTDSYINVSDADSYASNHFIGDDLSTWNGAGTSEKEAALRQATQYIDSYFRQRFPGAIKSTAQDLEWPRINAEDRAGRTLNDIPDVVKNATVELAKERLVNGDNLINAKDRGGHIKREQVGNLEVEYMDDAPAQKTYEFAQSLLSLVLVRNPRRVVRV